MREFAATYPEDVAALILVDSVHEDWYNNSAMTVERKTKIKKMQKVHKLGNYLADLGFQGFSIFT
ncbi:hypothetical protein BACCIP111883_04535 [Sutcliffiella rhizosphaerae]|uniref:Uncharacterized protein n=2 Tax=Sutcliffiella rhizosphaerae TaxID=2880967 RepID=A0ABM8YUN5_9BACI|nr:hypothetical protein BACCIP111883_04535 [Sutcliffiella rhizosphaerae]